jgi:16S rRNA processing protein RimM
VDRDFVSIGRLGAPKGVRGDIKVHSHSGESDHFRKLKEVELRGDSPAGAAPRELRIKVLRVEGEGSSLTMAFEGYPTPETARALTGMEVIVPRAAASPLRANEWYIDDLVGLAIIDASGSPENGRKLAVVRSVLEGGAEPWLEVVVIGAAGPAQGTYGQRDPERIADRNPERVSIVPFRKEFVGRVDLAGATIELLVPELLALGPPGGPPDE